MDASTIGLITTSLLSVIAALAAAYNTVRKTETETLRGVVATLERRVTDLESDLKAEREAHKAARDELALAREDLRKCIEQRTRAVAQPVA